SGPEAAGPGALPNCTWIDAGLDGISFGSTLRVCMLTITFVPSGCRTTLGGSIFTGVKIAVFVTGTVVVCATADGAGTAPSTATANKAANPGAPDRGRDMGASVRIVVVMGWIAPSETGHSLSGLPGTCHRDFRPILYRSGGPDLPLSPPPVTRSAPRTSSRQATPNAGGTDHGRARRHFPAQPTAPVRDRVPHARHARRRG